MQQTLSLDGFRDQHGDPDRWTAADIDSYVVIGDIAPPTPPLYSYAEMQKLAACHARSADAHQAMADQLASEGHDIAAGIWSRGADEQRELAEAARHGYPYYEAWTNDW
ncbi:hypothetical protein [Streptomyces sp. AM 2-1-1]|uniref:hypothetical protein n=1 Tax=Streptomyces sp. AM 2-1-1 TaxID=3028709 RepID=UPI0023BA0767|nr:hypothetical protein [Streptomyces sp. AM 2-1-1]WEH43980.1 hypothetical protein PZB77_30935 [Streptomyces sp. AM 2-1-1]